MTNKIKHTMLSCYPYLSMLVLIMTTWITNLTISIGFGTFRVTDFHTLVFGNKRVIDDLYFLILREYDTYIWIVVLALGIYLATPKKYWKWLWRISLGIFIFAILLTYLA